MLAIGGTDGCCVLGSVECYDTSDPSGGWLPLRPLNHAREGAAAVVLGDAVFVLGGHDAHEHLCSVEMWRLSPFRPESSSSSSSSAAAERRAWMMRSEWKAAMSMVQPRSWLGAAAVGESVVALGGDCGRAGHRLHSVESCFPAAASQHYSTAKVYICLYASIYTHIYICMSKATSIYIYMSKADFPHGKTSLVV